MKNKKYKFLLLFCLVFALHVYSQDQTINGNLYVSPNHEATGYSPGIYFTGNTDDIWLKRYNAEPNKTEFRLNISDDNIGDDKFAIGTTYHHDSLWYPYLTVLNNGNVGIGTSNPQFKFDAWGSGRFCNSVGTTTVAFNDGDAVFALGGGGEKGAYGAPTDKYPLRLYESFGWNFTLQNIINHPETGAYSAFRIKTVDSESWNDGVLFQVRADGNVGIGTANPVAKLTVAGDIHSREIKVSVDAGADYVFKKDYRLQPLHELEAYIKRNQHLPEIVSASEMEKDGINVSEMNIKLLKKIEELTLHIIEQDKRIRQLEFRDK